MSTPGQIIELCDACKSGDLKKVETLVNQGVDINSCSPVWPGYTPLMYAVVGGNKIHNTSAVANGNIDVIAFLVYSGAELQMKSTSGRTVFQISEFATSDRDFFKIKRFLIDINGSTKIMSIFKILYHKYIYLGAETIFDLVQTLSVEGLEKKGGKKRKTIKKNRSSNKKSKRRRL